MVLFFEVTLAISIVGLTVLLILKRYEVRSGRKVFRGLRPFFDRFFHRVLVWIEYIIPDVVEAGSKRAAYSIGQLLRSIAVRIMKRAEDILEKLLSHVRKQTQPELGTREASTFLREVADHKRSVMNGKDNSHMIIEE